MNTITQLLLIYNFILFNVVDCCELIPKNQEKLNVEVFYNKKRSDSSINLIWQVCDAYQKFGDRMTVDFFLSTPLTVTDKGITCDGDECEYAVKVACGDILAGEQNKTAFTCCMDSWETCIQRFNINKKDMDDCLNKGLSGPAGQRLVDYNNLKAGVADLEEGKLPVVVFNHNKYDECTDNAAYDDFIGTCCQLYDPASRPEKICNFRSN